MNKWNVPYDKNYKIETVFAVSYFVVYLGYLFVNPENELLHWITLVVLPLVLLALYYKKTGNFSLRAVLESCGLSRSNWKNGIVWSIILGLALSVLQLFVSKRSDDFLDILYSGKVYLLLPIAFFFLILTAGFTEEFFFRGILLTRLDNLLNSKILSIAISSILFGLYHFPYAYLNPNWPTHGDLGSALTAALGEGMLGGVILGIVYLRTKNNLVASVLVHALIDLFPAMTMIKFSG